MKYLITLIIFLTIFAQSADAKTYTIYVKNKGENGGKSHTAQLTPTPSPVTGVRVLDWEDKKVIMAKVAKKHGIPPQVAVSMMALESMHGRSNFCKHRNNCWGIAAYDSNPNAAWTFKTFQEGAETFAKLLSNGKYYKKAYQVRHDPYQMIKAIKKAGYASAPDYVEKVMSMKEWSLYEY